MPSPRLITVCVALGLVLASCVEVTIPPEAPGSGTSGTTTGPPVVNPPIGSDDPTLSGADASSGLQAVDAGSTGTGGGDVEVPTACGTHCDCPPGLDCINLRCVLGDSEIQCCTHPGCPSGAPCWFADGQKGACQ